MLKQFLGKQRATTVTVGPALSHHSWIDMCGTVVALVYSVFSIQYLKNLKTLSLSMSSVTSSKTSRLFTKQLPFTVQKVLHLRGLQQSVVFSRNASVYSFKFIMLSQVLQHVTVSLCPI